MKKLAVLVVHGMGDQKADFADGMIKELERRIRDDEKLDPGEIEWRPVWWAPVLSGAESDLWRRSSRSNDLDYRKLRLFVLHALGDAVAYRQVDKKYLCAGDINAYEEIHAQVEADMRALRQRSRAGKPATAPEVPLIVVAHSLGCHILSNYIWDRQKRGAASLGNDFEDMKTLSGFLTFGCNIPLFTLAHKKVAPIRFPVPVAKYFPRGTGANVVKGVTKWWNYYDPDDILGWPLKPLSAAYRRAVHKDVAIDVGGFLTSWNPASHGGYWEDNDFTVPTSKAIAKVLRLL